MVPIPLKQTLRRVAFRVLGVRTLAGLGCGLVAGASAVVCAVWLDLLWELPPWACVATPVVALATLVAFIAFAVRSARRGSSEDALARALDHAGGTGGRIRTGTALLRSNDSHSPLTAGLAAMAVAEAGQLAGSVRSCDVAPLRSVVRPFLAILAGAIVAGLVHLYFPGLFAAEWLRFSDPYGDHPPYSRIRFAVEPGDANVVYGSVLDINVKTDGPHVDRLDLILEPADGGSSESLPLFAEGNGIWRTTVTGVTAPLRYHVKSSMGRSPRFSVGVITVPNLERVRVRITPPAYTLRPPYEGPPPPDGLTGLPGTRVELWAVSNRPLSGGTIVLMPKSETVRVTPVSPGASEVTASFELRANGKMQLSVTDIDGRESSEPFAIPISLLADERPFVRMVQPKEQSIATPTATIPVAIAAEDDYGIAKVRFFRSVNDSRPMPFNLPLPPSPVLRTYDTVPLPLAAFGLKPGDELKLFARVSDTDPAITKGAETPIAVIRIIAQTEFERMVRARQGMDVLLSKYRQAQRRLEAAAAQVDELQKKRKDAGAKGAATDADRDELQKLSEKLAKDAQAARDAAQPLGNDLDRNLNEELKRLAEDLDEMAKAVERLSRQEGLTQEQIEQGLARLAEGLGREKQEYEKNVLEPLEFLKTVLPLLEDAKRFEELVARQKELASRLADLKQQDRATDPAIRDRMKLLQAEQEQIRNDLSKLLDSIEEKVENLSDNPALEELKQSAREFVEAVRTSGATDAMVDAESGLSDLSGKRGHAGAAKAAEILEGLLAKEQGAGGMSGSGRKALRFCPGLGNRLGNTLDQMMGQQDGGGQGGFGMSGQNGSGSQRKKETGLYGGLPGLGDITSGEATTGKTASTGANDPRNPNAAKGTPGIGDGKTGTPATSGTRDAVVPTNYRRRVAEYFQRVTDETGK